MDQERTLDFREIIQIIRKRMMLILIIIIACISAAGILNYYVLKPVYKVKTSIIIGTPKVGAAEIENNDVYMYQNLIKTYSEIADSIVVAENAAEKLKNTYSADQIMQAMDVSYKTDTQILNITARSGNAQEAVKIADAVAEAFIEESIEVLPTSGEIQVIDSARLPKAPIKPNKKLNFAIAFFMGLVTSLGLVFVMEYMDKTVKTEEDVDKYLELPVIGIIPKFK